MARITPDELGRQLIAARDGLTPDQVQVLIEQWAFPWGIAVKPAFDKALANHPHWQSWLAENPPDRIPTLEAWRTFTRALTQGGTNAAPKEQLEADRGDSEAGS